MNLREGTVSVAEDCHLDCQPGCTVYLTSKLTLVGNTCMLAGLLDLLVLGSHSLVALVLCLPSGNGKVCQRGTVQLVHV